MLLVKLYLIPFLHQTTTKLLRSTVNTWLYLIPFLHQTTTKWYFLSKSSSLYLIPFLHQTTTSTRLSMCRGMLYLIPFLHQTTTSMVQHTSVYSCILFHFYIKPQRKLVLTHVPTVVSYSISTSNHNRQVAATMLRTVVSYSISTSNHNYGLEPHHKVLLYLIPFLHQTTTQCLRLIWLTSCILFHFYIKPQPLTAY